MSTTPKPRTKAATLARVQALIAGTLKNSPSSTFTLGNTPYTTASLVTLLEGVASALLALNAAQAAAKDALATSRAAKAAAEPVIQLYERLIQTTFSGSEQMLADYGVASPRKPGPRTVEQLAAAAAKAEATRIARGTTSRKKKLAIRGNVTGVVVTPVTAPAPTTATEPKE